METIFVNCGGESRGDPGPAAVGVYVADGKGVFVREVKQMIGNATSVYAAYYAVALALSNLKEIYAGKTTQLDVQVLLSDEFVEQQLSGVREIKEPGLVPLFIEIHNQRVLNFPRLTFAYVPQVKNIEVNRLIAEAFGEK